MSSPASCFFFSQFAMRPRPDHVSFVLGSRYLAFTSDDAPTREAFPFGLASSPRAPC